MKYKISSYNNGPHRWRSG